ncbi:shikimate kinase [Adhaeretor mobilis]|nr:gluconokinase [Adhaeretor mobilis]
MLQSRTHSQWCLFFAGVQGAGKSTVALRTGVEIGCPYVDADDYHSEAAIQLMSAGKGVDELGEQYREQWLQRVIGACRTHHLIGLNVACACSLLTKSLRAEAVLSISDLGAEARVVFLDCSKDELCRRLTARDAKGQHFARLSMLDGQLEALELPIADEESNVVVINADDRDPARVACRAWLASSQLHPFRDLD